VEDEKISKWLRQQILYAPKDPEAMVMSHQCEPLHHREIQETSKVFGVDLSKTVGRLGVTTKWTLGKIPRFLKDIFDFLETEQAMKSLGLFRTSGNQVRIQELKDQLDDCGGESMVFANVTQHDLAGLLKLYLRELPEPLITSRLYNSYVAVSSECDTLLFLFVICYFILKTTPHPLHKKSATASSSHRHSSPSHSCYRTHIAML